MSLKAPIERIKPNPWNVNILTEEEFKRLKRLMEISGLERTPPVIVRERNGYYEIVDGEQRWKAAQELGWRELPIMIIKASDLEAKKYTLSLNYLKGRVNYVKIIQLIAEDREAAAAAKEVFSEPEAAALEKLAKLHREGKLTRKALSILEEGIRKGKRIELRMLEDLEAIPEIHQDMAVRLILMAHDPGTVKEIMLRQFKPEGPSEAKEEDSVAGGFLEGKAAKPEEATWKGAKEERKTTKGLGEAGGTVEEAGKEERAAAESIEKSIKEIVAPAEAIVTFKCEECGTKHTIYYNRERRTIEVYRIKDVWKNGQLIRSLGSEAYDVSSMKFPCPGCGRTLTVNFDERKVMDLGEDRED